MKSFEVTWHLDFWEDGVEKITTQNIEAENLDNLFDILDGGIEEGEFCPEDEFQPEILLKKLSGYPGGIK